MRPIRPALVLVVAWAATCTASAVAPASSPEIQRPPAAAQAPGVVHTLRAIPEACIRFEGAFTGQPDAPYRMERVSTSPPCQPRARWVAFEQAGPSEAEGWIFNDLIRVPALACPPQAAVLRVWRKPGAVAAPALDAQGRSRIYLEEARQQVAAGPLPELALYTAELQVEGTACR